jgi:hypothetical protein
MTARALRREFDASDVAELAQVRDGLRLALDALGLALDIADRAGASPTSIAVLRSVARRLA